jgi:2-oxoglutarate ferredoxin oxidoreductase subunit beta
VLALGTGARFVARAIDTHQNDQVKILKRAHAHRGASFVEIFQNCIVYNDNVFADFTEKKTSPETQLYAEHAKPLLFGKDRTRGLRLRPNKMELEVVTVGEDNVTEDDILVHDETNRPLASMLASLQPPTFPMVLGVLYCSPRPTYEEAVFEQIQQASSGTAGTDIASVLRRGRTWTVAG